MMDKETRAHDFAIAAVKSYQDAKTDWSIFCESKPKFDINELAEVYLDAYEQMCEKMDEEE